MGAELVLYNGRCYTMDAHQPLASALAMGDGRILYAGDDATARALLRPGGEAVDLRGACALPGLTDAHFHLLLFAQGLQAVQAERPTPDEVLVQVAEQAAHKPAGSWIGGFGWNHNLWGGAFPTAAMLDRVAPQHVVALSAKSGHALWVNSRALALAGITAATPDPPGGRIVRDDRGQPTGVLLEEAMALVERLRPQPTLDEVAVTLRQALALLHRAGLTGLHNFDGPPALAALQVLRERGELTLRVQQSVPLEHLDEAVGLGLRTGFGDDWLWIGQVKIFADGALGPRTAWMLQGYEMEPHNTGIPTTPVEVIRRAVGKANAAGLGCAIHAIGDRAVREVLGCFQEAQAQGLGAGLRNRIEHVQLIHPEDLGRLAALGVIASMQPIHATSDMEMAERHWGARSAGAYAWRSLWERGTVLAFGSDCPVETPDPLLGLHAAVTRRRADGSPGPEGWHPQQRLTAEQAVRGFTWGPAYAAGKEDRLGVLAPGKLADVTILDRDILALPPMEILQARVLGTMVGGRFAWRDGSL